MTIYSLPKGAKAMNTNTRTLFVIAAMMVFVISCQKQTPPPPQPTPLKFTPSFKEWVLQWEVGNMGSASAYFICDRNSPSIGVHSTNPKILIVEPIRFSQFRSDTDLISKEGLLILSNFIFVSFSRIFLLTFICCRESSFGDRL